MRSREISYELIPFLQFTISQTAVSHLSSGSGESSTTLPVFTENCLWHSRLMHFHIRRALRYETLRHPQCGHTTPSSQRIDATKSTHTSGSAKYRAAWRKLFGKSLFFMVITNSDCKPMMH